MKQSIRFIDFALLAKITIALLTGFIFFFVVYSMTKFSDGNYQRKVSSMQGIISKALITCYALEGAYPASINHIEKYGVVLDNENFIYHYEWYGANLKPNVFVIEKQ